MSDIALLHMFPLFATPTANTYVANCFREAYDLISILSLLLSVSLFHYLFVCADVEKIRNNRRERTLTSGIQFGSVRL